MRERNTADSHVAMCSECDAYLRLLRQLDSELTRRYAGMKTPPEFADRVLTQVRTEVPLMTPSFLPELLDLIGWSAVTTVACTLVWIMVMRPY